MNSFIHQSLFTNPHVTRKVHHSDTKTSQGRHLNQLHAQKFNTKDVHYPKVVPEEPVKYVYRDEPLSYGFGSAISMTHDFQKEPL